MKRFIIIGLLLYICFSGVKASNVKIVDQPIINPYEIRNNIAIIDMKIAWDNSWRDDYNWDAVYVFLKCKKDSEAEWSHVWLESNYHEFEEDSFTYWMAEYPDGSTKDKAAGIFVYRKKAGAGTSEVTMHLKWDISKNGYTKQDLIDGVAYEAEIIEMVYVPKGPFFPGDQYSKRCFQKNYRQILPEWDLISPNTRFQSESCYNSSADLYDPTHDYSVHNVCDRINDSRYDKTHVWRSELSSGTTSIIIDLETKKRVRYVAVEGYETKPLTWSVKGGTKLGRGKIRFTPLGSFSSDEWMSASQTSYPITRAVALSTPGEYQYYMFEMHSNNWVYVKNISMTDKDLETLNDDGYVIDGPGNTITLNETLGLTQRESGASGSTAIDRDAPVGYEGFYAMKYEISQAQYVGFLNKLLYGQQKFRTVGDRLDDLNVGDFVYGTDKKKPSFRNGIVVGAKQDNRYIFTSNLNADTKFNGAADGQNIACNYLSPADMLAYASWVGLRPLSELEYEKMAKQGYDPVKGKVVSPKLGEYAWGTAEASHPKGQQISSDGTANEKLGGTANVNVSDMVSGPVRVGSFAAAASTRKASGGGYSGAMELSGNLAEIYYTSLPVKDKLKQVHAAHGRGMLTSEGDAMELNNYWGAVSASDFPSYFIPRGGSFRSEAERARISDRSLENYFTSANQKDSTMTFRLGHSLTAYQSKSDPAFYPYSYLKIVKGRTTKEGTVKDSLCTGTGYTIEGSKLLNGKGSEIEADLSGPVSYVWYTQTTGPWMIMKGKNTKDLKLEVSDLQNKSSEVRSLSFKRRAYTPTQYSETGVVQLYLENSDAYSHDKEEILQATNQVNGILVETRPKAKFVWKAEFGGKTKVLPATNSTSSTSSYLAVVRDSFPKAGTGYLYCDVTTEQNKCKKQLKFQLIVKERPTTGINTKAMTLENCGQFIQDARDQEVYGTVRIGKQCWMAENMRYAGSDVSPKKVLKEKILGIQYWTSQANSKIICPEGWRVPRDGDFAYLNDFVGQGKGNTRVKLKAGNFWKVSNSAKKEYRDYIYGKKWFDTENPTGYPGGDFNSSGFGMVPGGYDGNDDFTTGYLMGWFDNPWQKIYYMNNDTSTLTYWILDDIYVPVRCILTSTSVD